MMDKLEIFKQTQIEEYGNDCQPQSEMCIVANFIDVEIKSHVQQTHNRKN